ncbi:hypothetical protein AU490_06445 [Lonsdalea populi]|uniref:hypothetical protein n=1 Tax=Lonsdalea TaxID=1082702 RepID=UPI000DCA535B|nr:MULTISPECIES: hypothetical protein [Lonsdalea]RAT12495.1 hypothetical protein AU486_16000 [Lonsdalea quercina]RAT29590.1 hypothetical protein AU490_06445 [Lonsdalea populi]RAT34654.1 hypothetical protein AU491_08930 [Lonsdalea populi]RAT41383.1 hypothetical protein AU496_15155 [Lonsdalea populi]RAT54510.1 hypothetical protein AU498_04405 [Lonsdalea populi]
MPVGINTRSNRARRHQNIVFHERSAIYYIGEDKKKIKLASLIKRNEQPIYLDDSMKQAWAVLLKDANIPVLLDDCLMRLDLSDAERESLRIAFER